MSEDLSFLARSASEAVERLSHHDLSLQFIDLDCKQHTDAELAEMADCLLARPNAIGGISLRRNQLTDVTGVKLARYVATSSTIQMLNLDDTQCGQETHLAMAAALRVNKSLRWLYMSRKSVDWTRVDAAYVEALWLNPDRPVNSVWRLSAYVPVDNELGRLLAAAEQLGHPPLQLLLAARLPDRPTTPLRH